MHYPMETDLTADGDKWTWLHSPFPAEEMERLIGPEERTLARRRHSMESRRALEIQRCSVETSLKTALCLLTLCGLVHSGHRDFSMTQGFKKQRG